MTTTLFKDISKDIQNKLKTNIITLEEAIKEHLQDCNSLNDHLKTSIELGYLTLNEAIMAMKRTY